MRKSSQIKKLIALTLCGVIGVMLFATGCDTDKPGKMRELTSMELVADMGIGWNLGNTLEACGNWINGADISSYETAWGNPITTKEMLKGIKETGFNSVRIPVAWSNLIADDHTISAELMDRVEEVVNYVLDNDMYAIVNIHWDDGWFEGFSTKYDECLTKYKAIWTQITERFKDYSDYLVFESLNEEGVFPDVWNHYGGSAGEEKTQAYDILNNINQEFVDLVRGSGGNNVKRHLLIAGYATDIDLTSDPAFKMPNDTESRCIVSVHYYTPSTFTILEKDADWGKAASTWGSEKDLEQLRSYMDKLKTAFVDKGIPVIVGEYGAATKNKEVDSVRLYITTVCKEVYDRGMCPMLWDPGSHFNRSELKWRDTELANQLKTIADTDR